MTYGNDHFFHAASEGAGVEPPSSRPLRCLVPAFDGAYFSEREKEALWDRFYTGVKGGLKGDQGGGVKGSHCESAMFLGDCRGEGLWSVAEEAFAPARRVWWGGARSWASVCCGSV